MSQKGTMIVRPYTEEHMPCTVLVFQFAIGGTTYYAAIRAGDRGWVLASQGENASTVFQAALNLLPTGGELFVKKAAAYTLKQIQLVYSYVHIRAELGTTFQDPLDGTNMFEIPLPAGASVEGITFEDISFSGGVGSGIAITTFNVNSVKYVRDLTIRNCHFNFNIGGAIFLNNFENAVIDKCRFVDANGQPMIVLQNNGYDSGNTRLYDNRFFCGHNTQNCVYVHAQTGTIAGINCRDNHFSFTGNTAMVAYRLNVNGGFIIIFHIDSDRYENCDQVLHIDTNSTQYCNQIHVHDINYWDNQGGDTLPIIQLHTGIPYIYDVRVYDGRYIANSVAGKYWLDSQNAVLTINAYHNRVGGFATGRILGLAWNVYVYDNEGYNPVGVIATPYGAGAGNLSDQSKTQAFPSTATNYTVTNSPKLVTIYGGTVTSINIGGTATGLTSGAFYLKPGQVLNVVWTVQPSSVVYAL